MSRHPFAALAAAAVLIGAVVAIVLALTLRPADADERGGDPLAPAGARAADARRPDVAPARPDPVGGAYVRLQATSAIRIEARAPDPDGGAPWAVRTFEAQRRAGISGRPAGRPSVCAQLGRVYRGRFGWIDAANTFRPGRVTLFGQPILCGVRSAQAQPQLQTTTTISDPSRGSAQPLTQVVWGMAGAPARVALRLDGRLQPVASSPRAAVLTVRADSGGQPLAAAAFRYRDGTVRHVALGARADAERFGAMRRMPLREPSQRTRLPLTELPSPRTRPTIELRLPDVNGGVPWGIAVTPTAAGRGWCQTSLGQIVGDRVGQIDEQQGTFADGPPIAGCIQTSALGLSRRRPLTFGYSFSSTAEALVFRQRGSTVRTGRIARRTLRGQTAFSGVASPDVVSITIATPRDVRTITPSRRAHLFAAIYDGAFPAGEILVSARLRDGSVHRERPISISF